MNRCSRGSTSIIAFGVLCSASVAAACWTMIPAAQRCGDPDSGGTLVCNGVEYPLWKVQPAIINICSEIGGPGGWGRTKCTNGGTEVYAHLLTYACDGNGFPYVITSIEYGDPCYSAQLTGGDCQGES